VEYRFPEAGFGSLAVSGNFRWKSKWAVTASRNQARRLEGNRAGVFGARIDLYDALGYRGLRLSLIGTNLADRDVIENGIFFPFGSGIQWIGNTFEDPRHIAFEIGWDFGAEAS
jgi:hypothetical protein